MWIIRLVLWGLLGVLLAVLGFVFPDWQFIAVLLLFAALEFTHWWEK
jgi:hypothetical protein